MSELISSNSTKIVLGHPLSGALYAYFDKELNGGHHIEASKHHRYYKTLYGKHYETYIDIALTLCLIYENVILIAADNPVPDYNKYETDGEYYNPDFGLYFTWRDEANFIIEDEVQHALEDKEIQSLLWNIPKLVHGQIIKEVYFELSMASKFDAALFTLGKRQALAKRIVQIDEKENPEFHPLHEIKLVSSYLDITGLLFQPLEIQAFYYLKTEKDLRDYSNAFLKVLESFSPDNPKEIKRELLLLIREAISKDKLNSRAAGIFEVGSNLMNYIGLIPIVGTAAGLVGIGADWTSKGLDKLSDKHKWYELAPQIQKTKSMHKIQTALANL
jgi:hypothetical protein